MFSRRRELIFGEFDLEPVNNSQMFGRLFLPLTLSLELERL